MENEKIIIYGGSSLISKEILRILSKDFNQFIIFCRKKNIVEQYIKEFNFLQKLSESLNLNRDFKFKYLGLQTLYDRYFLNVEGRRLESPQSFWMRVAMGLSLNEKNKEQKAIEFYETISQFRICPSVGRRCIGEWSGCD